MHNNKTNFIIFIIFLAVAMCNLVCFAQTQEQLDITTYYPSPTGVYQQLRLFPKDFDTSVNCNGKEGTLAFHATNDALYVCKAGAWARVDKPATMQSAGWFSYATDVHNSTISPAQTCILSSLVMCPDTTGPVGHSCRWSYTGCSGPCDEPSFEFGTDGWHCKEGPANQAVAVHCCFAP